MARKRTSATESAAGREADAPPAFGPSRPAAVVTPRERLCRLLRLTGPTDDQLFGDAAARIEELESEPRSRFGRRSWNFEGLL